MLVRAMRETEQELAGLRVPARRQHTLDGSLAEWQGNEKRGRESNGT
jgi:hypothetical protein